MKVNLEKLKSNAAICANKDCPKFDQKAVMMLYPSSVYCSLRCKYTDTDTTHKETYGD
jgi:hypothetical protein